MNIKKLKESEKEFLKTYPDGFKDAKMEAIAKKHKMDKMVTFTQDSFKKTNFKNTQHVLDNMIKVVSRSSMVSVFEKPKFRDFVLALDEKNEIDLAKSLNWLLHGNTQKGFELMIKVLKSGKLAKWTLLTIWLTYYKPTEEVFVKPTTAKGVIQYFELNDIVYKPTPTWDFYITYKQYITSMKSKVKTSLSPSNAAFSGFLMMSLK